MRIYLHSIVVLILILLALSLCQIPLNYYILAVAVLISMPSDLSAVESGFRRVGKAQGLLIWFEFVGQLIFVCLIWVVLGITLSGIWKHL